MNDLPFPALRCFAVAAALISGSVFAHGPGKQNDFAGRRVLFIGIDGCRADAVVEAMARGLAPQLKALSTSPQGLLTRQIHAGGGSEGPTHQPTVSGPGWSSLLTGVWVDKHNVSNNRFLGARFQSHPHFMRRLKELKPTAWCASFVDWAEIHNFIADGSKNGDTEFLDAKFTAAADPALHGKDYLDNDIAVRNAAIQCLREKNPDALFVYFGQVDEYGHGAVDSRANFSPDSTLYLHGIGVVDSHIGEVVRALRQRPAYADEDWLIVLTTDHGGRGNSHGGDTSDERNIWLIANGSHLPAEELQQKPFGQTKVPHLLFQHLGLTSSPEWDIQ